MTRLRYFIVLFVAAILTIILENPIPWLLTLIFGTYFRLKDMNMMYPKIRTFGIFTPFYNIYLFLLCFFINDYATTSWNIDKTEKHSKVINGMIITIIIFMVAIIGVSSAIPLFL